jgi:pre-rRNA-processing protein IPI3
VWDLSSRTLSTTFHFPEVPQSVILDPTERSFFASALEGSIFQVNLFKHRQSKFAEAVGGGGANDLIRIEAEKKRHIQVGQPITCMSLSLNCSLLLVGTSAGTIHVYDVPTQQLLRSINTHKGMSITYLATMLRPPDLVGHISLNLHVGSAADAKDILPMKPVATFQRVRDMKARQIHEVPMLLTGSATVSIANMKDNDLLIKFWGRRKMKKISC